MSKEFGREEGAKLGSEALAVAVETRDAIIAKELVK